MLTDEQRRTLEPVAHDLASATLSQRDTVAALFEAYVKASRNVTYQPGTPNPSVIQLGLIASALGLTALCGWLKEAGRLLGGRYWNMAVENQDWLDRKLDEVGLRLPITDKL